MSSRNFRKVAGQPTLPPAPDDSDGEYQPLYAQRAGNSQYAGLAISSQSESERSSERSEEESYNHANVIPSGGHKKKNFRKKGRGRGRKPTDDMDEIDRSVQEVNAMLGTPPPAPTPQPPKVNQALAVLALDPKHLNVANELKRLFGPEESEHSNRRARVQPNRALLLRRVLIHPNKDTAVYDFNNTGLSMTKYKEINNRMYFVFNHSESYQKMHRAFLVKFATEGNNIVMNLDEARQHMHVEALLEISDRLFRMEENSAANEILENVVTFLQYVAHPLFILSQNNVRLDYKFMENRPFHVAMLKYVYLLSNKACHRTALEIAKMMLLVDPNDPLALLSIIDILALRAREHEWLIETIAYFDRQREAGLLYNIKYSNALAHFHVALKNKTDFAEADRIIQEAILAHPQVFVKILECCSVSDPKVLGHEIFKKEPRQLWTAGVEELFMIYAKMTWPRWNEPAVMGWLMKNAAELCENYNNSPKLRETAEDWGRSRHGLFQVWPPEYIRHISVLSSMAKLILDAPLTSFFRPTCAWDPVFDKSVNRYNYSYHVERPRNVGASRSPVYSNDIRNDFLLMLSQISMHPGCVPFVTVAPTEAGLMMNPRVPRHGEEVPFTYGVTPFGVPLPFGVQPQFNMPRPCDMHTPYVSPTINKDLMFDDDDSDFASYDYDDDEENFEQYEKEMAAAMDEVILDERINNIFKPTNMN